MSASLTEQAATLAIDGACRSLHLPTIEARTECASTEHWIAIRLHRRKARLYL
jgi:hypothetical protein